MPMAVILGIAGCATVRTSPDADKNRYQTREADSPGPGFDPDVRIAAHDEVEDEAQLPLALPVGEPGPGVPPDLSTPQPLDALLARALEVNPTVQAARFNVQALQHRIPQVTALEDPVLSNTIFPIPSVAPQYSLMGYMPYAVLLAQQFPWCGTLRLRGLAAEDDVRIALQELAASQLDVVAGVKRAYHDLHFNEKALVLLDQNRGLAEDFLKVARQRYRLATAAQADVLRAEVAVSDIDRERETTRQAVSEARSELARLLRVGPETALRTVSDLPVAAVPQELDRLAQLACASRPELQGRLAAIARDRKAVELARKRYYPNLTVGLVYQDMQKTNAMTPATATGQPNVGFFVGMNLPVYHKKLAAGVHEAEARAAADAKLYEAERDQARRDIKDLFTQATVQQNVLSLLQRSNLPAAKRILDLTASDYRAGTAGVDYLSLIGAWRELLQVQLQVAQVEAELGKTLATLERAVGVQLNEHPPDPQGRTNPPGEETRP
jgi:outer membrane protein TolC